MKFEKFKFLKEKYGQVASWAIWSRQGNNPPMFNMGDLTILDPQQNPDVLSELKPDIVFVGLNVSRNIGDLEPFSNFHPNYHNAQDYKLRNALYHTELWGGYITDIIKDYPELHGQNVMSFLNDNPDVERKNIETFREELKDLGTENPTIIALGNDAYKILTRNLEDTFTIVKVTHYSAYINPQKYREEFESIPHLVNLINYIKKKNIVCPMPMYWDDLYMDIKNNIPSEIDLPMPLILAVWHEASHEQKKESFIEQILIAHKYGLIQRVSYFIMQLKDDELF